MDMVFATMTVFGATLALIVFLFILKHIEVRRGARFAESLRASTDAGALRVKGVLTTGEWYLEQTPWFISALTRYGVHVGALSFARLARTSAEYAHALADFVSHKRGFERKETKSQYLKEMSGAPRYTPEPMYARPEPKPEPEPTPIPTPTPIPASEPEPHAIREPVESKPRAKKRRGKRVASRG